MTTHACRKCKQNPIEVADDVPKRKSGRTIAARVSICSFAVASLCGFGAAGRHACATVNWRKCQIVIITVFCVGIISIFFARTDILICFYARILRRRLSSLYATNATINGSLVFRRKWLSGGTYAENCWSECNMLRTCCCECEAAYRPNGESDREKHKQRFRAIDTCIRHTPTYDTTNALHKQIESLLLFSTICLYHQYFWWTFWRMILRGNHFHSDWNFLIFKQRFFFLTLFSHCIEQCRPACHSITVRTKMARRSTRGQRLAVNRFSHWRKHSNKPNIWLDQNEQSLRTH